MIPQVALSLVPSSLRSFVRGAVAMCLLAVVTAASSRAAAAPQLDELQIKAAFLYNFALFVTWPDMSTSDGPFVIGVTGNDGVAAELERYTRGKKAQGRELVVLRLAANEDPRSCRIVYLGAQGEGQTTTLLRQARGAPVLTVGESPAFTRDGGVIRFLTDSTRVRFQINTAAAQKAGLRIAANLLALSAP